MTSEQELQAVATWFEEILTGDPQRIRQGEAGLRSVERSPGFASLLMVFLTTSSINVYTRLQASIYFKNYIKRFWLVTDEPEVIQLPERGQIKSNLVAAMLVVEPQLCSQLSEALTIISKHDFPMQWADLLPTLVSQLSPTDFVRNNGVLRTMYSVLERYCHAFQDENVERELAVILEHTAKPVLQLFTLTTKQIGENIQAPEKLKILLNTALYLLQIWYALNAVEIPEFFEDHIGQFMQEFHNFLIFRSEFTELIDGESDESPGILHQVQAQVCENVCLYTEKYEEQLQPYLGGFVQDVWTLLVDIHPDEKFDQLVSAGIKFLSSVSKSVHWEFFSNVDTLRQVCERIVIPNMRFTDADESNFEENPIEYIRRDIEGSDQDTRRHAACELVKGLRKHFEAHITSMGSSYIGTLLQEYAAGGEDAWKAKDVAIYLVTALTVTAASQEKGAVKTNELVPIADWFAANIYPELEAAPSNHPIIQADCLRFASIFANMLPVSMDDALLRIFVKLIASPEYVVSSYAAGCIVRMLSLRNASGAPRISPAQLKVVAVEMFTNLFAVLERPQSQENEYTMKAIMRSFAVLKEDLLELIVMLLQNLTSIIARVSRNPTKPQFNHYMFEALAALIRDITNANPATVPHFELALFPSFQHVIENQVSEFIPYVFQLMSMLLERNPDGVTPAYQTLLPLLTRPVGLWVTLENVLIAGNIPPLCRMLQAYIHRQVSVVIEQNQLEPLLGIYHRLIESARYDNYGLELLSALFETLPIEQIKPFLPEFLTAVFNRLQTNKTDNLCTSFITAISIFAGKHAPGELVAIADSQTQLFGRIISNVWLPSVQKVSGSLARAVVAIGMTRYLADCPQMLTTYSALWLPFLEATITLLEAPEQESDDIDLDEEQAFTSVYTPLSNASTPDHHPFPGVNPKVFLASKLHELSQRQSISALVSQLNPASTAPALVSYFRLAQIPEPYVR